MAAIAEKPSGQMAQSPIMGPLRMLILILIAGAAISSRLFSVIRFESIIHEFDPWFNYRASIKLVEDGIYEFWNWFDERSWYPLGRVVGGTLYPGLMVTSGIIYNFLQKINLPVEIRNICVMLAPGFSGLTALATYFFTTEMKNESAGLLAAAFVGIVPGYISRSVAGSYDNEAIAITLLMTTFFLWIKAQKTGSVLWSAATALFYFYMAAAWGGYVFITNMIPLHVFVLILMGRFSNRIYVAYSSYYTLGTLMSMQVPFVGFQPIRTSEHMAAMGIFGLVQIIAFVEHIRSHVPQNQFKSLLRAVIFISFILAFGALVTLTLSGIIAPWTGRFYSLWDTGYAKIHIPIIASVSEHQPTPWPSFFFDLSFLVWLFPVGIYLCFRELRDEHVFVILYAVMASYFSGVMVRLMLALTPCVCVAAAMAVSNLLEVYLDASTPVIEPAESMPETGVDTAKQHKPRMFRLFRGLGSQDRIIGIFNPIAKLGVASTFGLFLVLFVYHCTWVTSNAYSAPSVVLASKMPDGSQHIIDDFREAYSWLRKNTDYDARIMSWWDYGYQIAGMADRTTLVDNNTWNNTHIATVGKAMASSEEKAYPILRHHDVDYILVIFGGLLGYSGDDMNKFLWMIRISEGIWPDEVNERSFFTATGEYKIDEKASETMKNSLLYKMSYYRFSEIFRGQDCIDRVRNQIVPKDGPKLTHIEEAFTSENWIVRIYKVKDLDSLGREHSSAVDFEQGKKKRRRSLKKGARTLRVDI
ncbi:Dolichyl-diphosphooligosaccharide--protein glycosyltransferase subunit stt3 [Neolecta irregularis DAH-3]|uniref:Dolichyl-diphosphooligosaccharide--protein glycosyltransferase subunit STT3 n=1 Tax=Neolecta irregularis (strain DAH-3) TaxID=1198029 RepID=A0A1U7LWX5_NEOID|nr:Dolichyl-diphosphooligosaccharide--protein glycosyltransferase subunit stt3 [Neolecta irregularis DAH-3]|eukprot:OLL27118.1 Dolichyl-diphosphooligosaccharide--protein glycosyltransferase subunit stt3 [Neolecta irregularis DAH-3]